MCGFFKIMIPNVHFFVWSGFSVILCIFVVGTVMTSVGVPTDVCPKE